MTVNWRKTWKDNKRLVFFMVMLVAFKSSLADWNSVPTGSQRAKRRWLLPSGHGTFG